MFCTNHFSSTMRILGIESRPSGLAASPVTRAMSLALPFCFRAALN